MFWRKTLVAKINCYNSNQSKKLNQVTMIQIVSKKYWVTHELQGTDMSSMNKRASTYNSIKGVLYEKEKKIWKSLLGKKYLLGKPVHFSVKNTVNNVDTWRLIQLFFQHLYRTVNSIVHLIVWFETAQILRCRQRHILPGRIQHSKVVLGYLVVKVQHKFPDICNSIFH